MKGNKRYSTTEAYRGKTVKLPYRLSVQSREEKQAPRRATAATGSKLPTAVRLHHGEGAPEWMTSK